MITLQTVIAPQQGICTEQDLFFRLTGRAFSRDSAGELLFEAEAGAQFDTYFNLLSIGKWHRYCDLGGLALGLKGKGTFEVRVLSAVPDRSDERLCSEIVTLDPERETVIDLGHYGLTDPRGVLWFEVKAIAPDSVSVLTHARYMAPSVAAPMTLAVVVKGGVPAEAGAARGMLDLAAEWAAHGEALVQSADDLEGAIEAARSAHATHLIYIDPKSPTSAEGLNRVRSFMSLMKGPQAALVATTLDPDEKWRAARRSLVGIAAADGYVSADLRERDLVTRTEYAMAEGSPLDMSAQLAFLAAPLDLLTGSAPVKALSFAGLAVAGDGAAGAGATMTALQNLIFPEQGICTEQELFFHLHGPAAFSGGSAAGAVVYDPPKITLAPGSAAFFDTYFNALSIGKWHAACNLDGLFLALLGTGELEIKVFHAIPDRSWELLVSEVVALSRNTEYLIDLSHYALNATNGVIYFELRAVDTKLSATITGARYLTRSMPDPEVRLAVSITTFKREAQVEATAVRLDRFLSTSDFKDKIQVFVVDNGQTANIPDSPFITVMPNPNLGGAGGFSRGLVEAEERGISHVLFMDDDASILMENLHRSFAFLSLAADKKVAIAGAMINNTDKWRMWENGAVFDQRCMPLFTGVDLRGRDGVMQLEFESHRRRPKKMYGGWWFFAFPVAEVAHHPFPFFVRGDDVNFSLVNDFHITTLNGVVSFQDDFTDKESPLTWYLDLRSHLVHHLTLDKMEVGARRLAWIGVWFFLRNIVKFQYETIEAIIMAWNHVLEGPDFFVDNPDASGPRAAIKALTKVEAWKPVGDLDTVEKRRFSAGRGWRYRLYRATLNGHLLPFFKPFGNHVVLPPQDRGNLLPMWGASRITFLNSTREKGYTVIHSKTRFIALTTKIIILWLRTVLGYNKLRALYHRRYDEITTRGYWLDTLGLTAGPATSEDAEVADPPVKAVA